MCIVDALNIQVRPHCCTALVGIVRPGWMAVHHLCLYCSTPHHTTPHHIRPISPRHSSTPHCNAPHHITPNHITAGQNSRKTNKSNQTMPTTMAEPCTPRRDSPSNMYSFSAVKPEEGILDESLRLFSPPRRFQAGRGGGSNRGRKAIGVFIIFLCVMFVVCAAFLLESMRGGIARLSELSQGEIAFLTMIGRWGRGCSLRAQQVVSLLRLSSNEKD